MDKIKNRLAAFLYRIGISANLLTLAGLFAAGASAFLIYRGYFKWAGTLLLLSGFLDLMDGEVARLSGTAGGFGGILDSSLDRYGDGMVLAGILFYCAANEKWLYAVLAASALLGSFEISYVRARAECAVPQCRVGFWERGERIVYLALGLFFDNTALVLWMLGLATHWTVFQRLYHSHGQLRFPEKKIFSQKDRKNPTYFVKAGLLFLAVLFCRPVF